MPIKVLGETSYVNGSKRPAGPGFSRGIGERPAMRSGRAGWRNLLRGIEGTEGFLRGTCGTIVTPIRFHRASGMGPPSRAAPILIVEPMPGIAALSATRCATRLSRSKVHMGDAQSSIACKAPSIGISHSGQSSSPSPGSGRVPSKRTECNDAGSRPSARKIVGATCVVLTRRSTCRSW